MKKAILLSLALLTAVAPQPEDNVEVEGNEINITIENSVQDVNAGILYNINNELGLPYRPKYEDVDFIDKVILKDLDSKLATIWTGYYDVVNSDIPEPLNRAMNILGEDCLIIKDSFTNNQYYYEEMFSDNFPTIGQAVTVIQKTIGHRRYKISYFIEEDLTPKEESPLSAILENPNCYRVNSFITRTLPEQYWKSSIVDGLMRDTKLTYGDLALLIKRTLTLNGEPELNKAETEMLLVAQGKTLPYYLDTERLDAVKYLIARGILHESLNYSEVVNKEDFLTILMRAADKDSRMTYKYVDIPFISELVDKGYYPTELSNMKSPINNLNIRTNKAVSNYYDYYIKRDTNTTFSSNDLYVSEQYNTNGNELPDSQYLGVVGAYYHFQISRSAPTDNGCYTINTHTASDTPSNLKVQPGGGVYAYDSNSEYLVRSPFTKDDSEVLVDKERAINALTKIQQGIFLGKNDNETVFAFNSTDESIAKMLWDGKSLSEASVFKKLSDNEFQITVISNDPYARLLKSLSFTDTTYTSDRVKAYVVDGRSALVSLSWLKKQGLIIDGIEVKEDETWLLYSNNENIVIDLKNRFILSGQTITEIPTTDKSPLIYKDERSSEVFIDYRAVTGVSSDYLIVADIDGNITLSTKYGPSNNVSNTVYPLTSNETYRMKTRDGDTDLVNIENKLLLSNFLIYKDRNSATRTDYLICAKPSLESMLLEKKNELIDKFGLEFSDNIRVDYWEIGSSKKLQSGISLFSLKNRDEETDEEWKATLQKYKRVFMAEEFTPNKNYSYYKYENSTKPVESNGAGVYYDEQSKQYYYKVPEVNQNEIQEVYEKYMNGSDEYPLSYIRVGSIIYDMNINIFDNSLILKDYPVTLQSRNIYKPIFENNSIPKSMITAVTSLTAKYLPYEDADWTDEVTYYGTLEMMPEIISDEYYKETRILRSTLDDRMKITLNPTDNKFTEIFRGSHESIYSYTINDKYKITNIEITKEETKSDVTIKDTDRKHEDINWSIRLDNINLAILERLIEIIILLLLTVVPRILIFDFIAFGALAIVAEHRIVQKFASQVIDPYKILSFGLTDVTKVTPKRAWLSITLGLVLMILFVIGSPIEILNWLIKGLSGVVR